MNILSRFMHNHEVDETKLLYLRTHHKDVEIINSNIPKIKDIPNEWKDVLQSQDQKIRKQKLLSMWKICAGDSLRNTIAFLEDNLLCIDLIFYCGKYALLYTIKNARGEHSYYEGGNPKAFPSNKTLNSCWNRVPNSIKLFYQKLHDGFFYYASGAMGLVGENDVVRLADEDWGIIDDLSLEPPYDLASSFAFFATGAGGYCVIDTAKSDCENDSFLWFSASRPKYHINFWDVVDEWILIGMDH